MKHKCISIIILSLLSIITLIILSGCTVSMGETEKRFVFVSDEGNFDVYYDKITKVMYAVSDGYYNYGTVTLLVDQEGQPLLYKGE